LLTARQGYNLSVEPRTLRLLELDKVLKRLEDTAATALGQNRVRTLRPVTELVEVRQRQAETSQARRFLELGKTPPFGGISDISDTLRKAAIGSILEPRQLLAVALFASGSRRLRETILSIPRTDFAILHNYAQNITPRPDLEKAILDAIDESSGEIKDDASLALLRARRNMRRMQGDVQTRLRQMLSDPNVQPLLQDAFVTVRDGRYCLPVKAECRSRVPGIVHDRSGSGGAYFVEPQAVVEMNNRLRELLLEEQEAILAILTDLTHRVGGAHDDLMGSLGGCENLDFAFAKGQLSQKMKALEPCLEDPAKRSAYVLLQARHPLIEDCVPNDIFLGDFGDGKLSPEAYQCQTGEPLPSLQLPDESFDVMMITGPNTGGKTVVLKTLGLLICMAACGLHLPVAPGSWLALPGAVYADIGDEQSIEQSLSTFSSHIKQIVGILNKAKAGDLVLLDEVGAGTDPDEGASLAKAVLRSLQRRGVRVVATTHYGELKQFALGSARFDNASVEFDSKTLQPTYHLRIGVPGASNALDIAARLKMPPELVQRARRYLGRDRAEADAATQRLEETQRELEQQTASAQREREEVEHLRRDYEAKLARLQIQMEEERAAARREAEALVRQTQEEADAVLRELRSAAKESKQTEEARSRLRTLRERVESERKSAQNRPRPAAATEPTSRHEAAQHEAASEQPRRSSPPVKAPAVGDLVRVINLNKEGVLLALPDDSGRVSVRVGAIKLEVPAHQIEALPRPKGADIGASAIRIRKAVTVPEEINLIGKRVDEALPELEKYIDDALLSDADEVRIVHGRGTGALRTAVHRWLRGQRGVREFHLAASNEGGEGATVVHLS